MRSPSVSPPKTHNVMKLGFFCKGCFQNNIYEDRIKESRCTAHRSGIHDIVKKAFICADCRVASDHLQNFGKFDCDAKYKTPSPPAKPTLTEEALGSPPPEDPSPADAEWYMKLRMAELELHRLKIMKELELEREQLQLMMLEKQKKSSTNVPGSFQTE